MSAPSKRAPDSPGEVPRPPKISSSGASDVKLESFLRWCNDNKFNISPKVCVERERACAQYGMVARQDIVAGEVLFSIPRPSLLSPDTSSIATLLHKAQDELGEDSGWVPLLLALVYEYNNPQSSWRSYLDLVPDFAQLDLPMFWSREEREELLAGTGVEEAVSRDLSLLEKDFNTKALPFMQRYPDVFSPACQNLDLYKKMVAFVMAYSFTEPASKGAGADGKGKNDEDEDSDGEEEEVEGCPPPMMVPLADILNHVAKNNASLNFDVDALRMISTRDIKQGEEVFNTYGELANKHLLHMYGFAECFPHNHYDTVDLPVGVLTEVVQSQTADAGLMAAKLLFLQEQDLHQEGESYVVGREGVLTDEELQAVLKVLVMSADEFKDHAEKDGWSDAESDDANQDSSPLSFAKMPDLPASWKEILSRCAEVCLSKLGGTEEEDKAAMKTEGRGMASRARYAMYMRYGQRQLLRQFHDACR